MGLLKSPLFWLGMLGVAALLIGMLAVRRDRKEWGFRDFVKNPDAWDAVSQSFHDRDHAIEAAKSWDDQQVSRAVRKVIFDAPSSREAWSDMRVLTGLGERTHPFVLAILEEESWYRRLVKPTSVELLPEAPFNRACDILGDIPPARAILAVSPFLNDSSEEIRKSAALVIGKTGDSSIAPYIRRAFADTDEYVRSYALMGMEFAEKRQGLASNVKVELFPDVKQLLLDGKNAERAADMLFHFDPNAATEFFLSPPVFTAESPIIHRVLHALADEKVPVPRDKLRNLIQTLESQEPRHPYTTALAEALRLLGQHRLPEDRVFLTERTRHADRWVAEGAAAWLLCSHSLDGFQERLYAALEHSGYASLRDHQRYYLAVSHYEGEVNNGGFSQYFFNSSGDEWRDAVAGLEAMGSVERLDILRKAISAFGANGPAINRHTRQRQLSKFNQKTDAILGELDTRFYQCSEVLDVLASQFVLAHPESFR